MKKTAVILFLIIHTALNVHSQNKEKILVLSDIEGQYKALQTLLIRGKVIDSNQRWTFGKGHLVLLGDMIDRGDHVVEVWDLIKKLETEAQAAGGQVHYILGNHEIMNLSGDWRYVNKKYLAKPGELKPEYAALLSATSANGKWLRSKHIVEKIGDVLFVHAGISPQVNAAAISLDRMNEIAQKYLDKALYYKTPALAADVPAADRKDFELVFNARTSSPFWYRNYYRLVGEQFVTGNDEANLDSALQQYQVKHIVTGHSIVADTVTVHYGGKLFNTDVEHAEGHSEALLMEDGKYIHITVPFATAQWITVPYAEPEGRRPVPVFWKSFAQRKKVTSATLYITALGMYEAQLNGKKIGQDFFTPGFTRYDKRLQYQQYDVTRLIKANNELKVWVGEGWYRGPFRTLTGEPKPNIYGNKAGLVVELLLNYADGSASKMFSDSTWTCTESTIRYSELYDGEMQDTREGAPTFTGDRKLLSASGVMPRVPFNQLVLSEAEPVRKHETFKPLKIFTSPKGEQLIDFGQNLAGWVQIKVKGRAGDTILLYHAEVLDKEGNFYTGNLREAKATDTYILNGTQQTLEPHFTYHGFRYVKLVGIAPSKVQLTAIALYSDLAQTGTFSCSDPLINQLQHNIAWSMKSNFVDIPTDCPQRSERLGWTGDAQAICGTASFLMDTRRFFAKWLKDVAAEQGSNGAVPTYVPRASPGEEVVNGVAGWGDAATIVPWTMYTVYGDTAVLREQYASMKAWVDYVKSVSTDGLWHAKGYGDWYAQGPATDLLLINQCFRAHSLDILVKTANVLGYAMDAQNYQQKLDSVKQIFAKNFITPTGIFTSDTQTAYLLALQFNLLTEKHAETAVLRLVNLLKENNKHLATGVLGTPYLLPVLSNYGYSELAFEVLKQIDCPSWLYPVTKGATTMWEKWDAIKPDGTATESSFNHYAYGAVGSWLYEHLAGIQAAEPGYKKIIIKPEIGGGITWAKASYTCDYGDIVSSWEVKNGKLKLQVEIPKGTTAQIFVPSADEKSYHKHEVGSGKFSF
ncbi:alpha-L-rhamnosidase [bacterium A37T11]|nr:alpha-L-rhamnosidase [bacterium A37T11]